MPATRETLVEQLAKLDEVEQSWGLDEDAKPDARWLAAERERLKKQLDALGPAPSRRDSSRLITG